MRLLSKSAGDHRQQIACDSCNLNKLCISKGLDLDDIESLGQIVRNSRTLGRGDYLYRSGERFRGMLAIKSGTAKLVRMDHEGNELILDLLLPGELLGFDGLASQQHSASAVALEVMTYCEIPAHQFERLMREVPGISQVFMQRAGEQFEHHIERMRVSRLTAEERLATFLLDLSERYRRRGFSAKEFRVSMTRQDVGNYLGLAQETVSRLFSQFEVSNIIRVQGKLIAILDFSALLEKSTFEPED